VIPIIDLRKRLNLHVSEYDKNTRFIVIELEKNVVGFIVDSVNEVLRIDSNLTEAPPQSVSNVDTEFITSVAKLDDRLIILLDMNKILSKKEIKQLEKMDI
jgi:purine-binding chemotaxis protein CheW